MDTKSVNAVEAFDFLMAPHGLMEEHTDNSWKTTRSMLEREKPNSFLAVIYDAKQGARIDAEEKIRSQGKLLRSWYKLTNSQPIMIPDSNWRIMVLYESKAFLYCAPEQVRHYIDWLPRGTTSYYVYTAGSYPAKHTRPAFLTELINFLTRICNLCPEDQQSFKEKLTRETLNSQEMS